MFYTCGPNEAMVVSGKINVCVHNVQINSHILFLSLLNVSDLRLSRLPGFCRSPPLMIAGGRVFVVPCVQQIQR